ncbi:hypothetical protein GCM10010260_15920 [Streptomyces filipinensis]|uniref:Uncharacterized protein n=1 Tax=Streptomyces filipinensis TaxID=66887 RepID=A0A918I7B7_9ACTN|nr:hypothetical protein [Streptomyces filipinensis]GGU83930.1 hypothetical protein GCM10010260_15920 [Streptomyces filipinensis]
MPEPRPAVVAGVSMRDLLASCAAAQEVSIPPKAAEERPEGVRGTAPGVTAKQQTPKQQASRQQAPDVAARRCA